jgi:hypothetical protein
MIVTNRINPDYILLFKSIKNSHAYFFPEGCGCKTCNPCNPPEAPRHRVIEGNFAKKEIVTGGKRTRRGGRRRNPKKQRMESQEKKDGEPEESL